MDPFNVLYEKDDELVAQFKFTILLMPSGTHKITGLPLAADQFESESKIEDEELKKILATPLLENKKKKNKAKAKTGGDSEPAKTEEA